jgi:spermidine/putrescine-binding protein
MVLAGAISAALVPLAGDRASVEAPLRVLAWPMVAGPLRRAVAMVSPTLLVEIRIVRSDAEMLTALREPAGRPWDLAMPTERSVEAFLAESLLRPLSSNRCGHVDPWDCDRLLISAATRRGELLAVGARPAGLLIAATAGVAVDPPTSWREFWHSATTVASGRTAVPDCPRTLGGSALSSLGFGAASTERAERIRAAALIGAARPHVSVVADPLAELVRGRAMLALLRPRDRRRLPERCGIAVTAPVEQGESWATLFAVPRRSRRPDAAERVIAALLGEAVAANGVP